MRYALLPAILVAVFVGGAATAEQMPSFNREVRPLLAGKCFACHGPDESHREADLRLDDREVAVDFGAIAPGKPDESELIRRIFSGDPDEQMPPPDSEEKLTDAEKDVLRRWIADGAKFEKHWAFIAPRRPKLPKVQRASWPRNEIDRFVLARLEAAGLEPSPQADRYTLVRRVYLDLIGLPPTPAEADAFVNDDDPQAYDKLVDRLLDSQHYGEHWARQWLDLARYADTNGYEKDRPRSIWPYRDWVIRALNADMPFDQFTVEQLAGDMLPGATAEQRIATGFHRNTMLNEEGGIDPLEFRFYAMVDRVATTGTVWLGLTTGCAQCHSHKYDPISHTDYYRLMALLNNADEPDLSVPDESITRRRNEIQTQIADRQSAMLQKLQADAELQTQFEQWRRETGDSAQKWQVLRATEMDAGRSRLEQREDGSIFASGDATKRDVYTLRFSLNDVDGPVTALRLEALPDERLPASGPGRAYYEGRQGDFFLSEVNAEVDESSVVFADASHSFGKISIGSGNANATNVIDGNGSTGWSTATREGEPHQLVLNLKQPLADAGKLEVTLLFERHFAASLGRFRISATAAEGPVEATTIPVAIEALLAGDPAKLSDAQIQTLQAYFVTIAPALKTQQQQIDALRRKLPEFPKTLVMQQRPQDHPRSTHRHHRGEYLNAKEEVAPGVPAFLIEKENKQPGDRLEFARWLVSENNPLAARVTVNRAWQSFFGRGIVSTSGDFGTQASAPSHPELLDWLAHEFVVNGWSLKKLHRMIVTSATYRQSSHVSPGLLKRDPANELLARGPRQRVAAETVRDTMLRASGLLSETMYGPGVRPPQPASVTALAYGNSPWKASTGEDRYRRSIYTFKKRTAPFAAFATFDAPSGESCVARRNRSNTPLQALTLLNDDMYLEMARALARNAAKAGAGDLERAAFIFRRVLTRPPDEEEIATLLDYYQRQRTRLDAGELNAGEIAGDKDATAQQAAWTLLARVVMNLDEAIVKQ